MRMLSRPAFVLVSIAVLAVFLAGPKSGDTVQIPCLEGAVSYVQDRDGGYNVVNASGFSARADGSNEFRFGGGPVRRYVGEAGHGSGQQPSVRGFNVMPGGPSGVPGDPDYATQLGVWLTADYHSVNMAPNVAVAGSTRETFVPAP
jgi:acyl-homoserine lactone acylase PvdQ